MASRSISAVSLALTGTDIVDGVGSKSDIDGRVAQIRQQIETTASDYDREKLQERLAKLAGGVAIIKVGGGSEFAVKEKKDRVEDAMHATANIHTTPLAGPTMAPTAPIAQPTTRRE